MIDDLGTFLFDYETNRTINEALPDLAVDFFGLITRLGDGAVLVGVAMLLYWFGAPRNRHERAMVLAIAVTTLALVAGLKGILTIERPLYAAAAAGEPLAFAPEEYPGWSTPSAHAMGAAAVYGALAVLMETGKQWQRYAVAGFLIVTVPLSRVIIGVHYLGDVIAGALLGLLLVAIALRIPKRAVTSMFGLALAIAVLAFALGSEEFTSMSIGASLGGLVVWWMFEDRDPDPYGASILMFAILIIPALLLYRLIETFVVVDITVEVAALGEIPIMSFVSIGTYTVLFGLAIAVPYLAEKLNDWDSVRRMQDTLPFRGRRVETDAISEHLDD